MTARGVMFQPVLRSELLKTWWCISIISHGWFPSGFRFVPRTNVSPWKTCGPNKSDYIESFKGGIKTSLHLGREILRVELANVEFDRVQCAGVVDAAFNHHFWV